NGQTFIQLSLFNDGYFMTEHFGKTSLTKGLNFCVNSIDGEDGIKRSWYLVTNKNSSQQEMVSKYQTRFWIEESFIDLKSKLYWEKYTEKIPENNRLPKCIIISCLSYA